MAGSAAWLVMLAACSPSPSSAPATPPAKIAFAEMSYSFGHIDQGTPVTHRFDFRNSGGLDLTIDNVRASCTCTAVTGAKIVPPGGTGSVDVSFDTTDQVGRKARTITVYSHYPPPPVTHLTLVGTIHAIVAADPPQLYVGHLHRGETARNGVHVITSDAATLGPVLTDGVAISAAVEERQGDERAEVRVTIKPDAPRGPFRENVRVHTSDARRPVLVIRVRGTVDLPFVTQLDVEPTLPLKHG